MSAAEEKVLKKEKAIREEEYKRTKINDFWKERLAEKITQSQIKTDTCFERLLHSPPEGMRVTGPDARLNVVTDNTERYPTFSRLLYGNLDF